MLHVCILCLNILSLVSYMSYSSLSSFMESCTGARTRMTTDPHPHPKPRALSLPPLIQTRQYCPALSPILCIFNLPVDPIFLDFMSALPSLLHCCVLACILFSLACIPKSAPTHHLLLYRPWFFSMPVVPKSGIAVAGGVG